MRDTNREFDIGALFAAMDERRRARGLAWSELAREMSRAYAGTRARPISPSTLTGMRTRAAVDADGVMQVLVWLGRSPESFMPGHDGESREVEMLPLVGPSRILRFDTAALHEALDARRSEQGMTWTGIAGAVGGIRPAGLTRLARGGRIGMREAMRIVAWLGRPAASFTRTAEG